MSNSFVQVLFESLPGPEKCLTFEVEKLFPQSAHPIPLSTIYYASKAHTVIKKKILKQQTDPIIN